MGLFIYIVYRLWAINIFPAFLYWTDHFLVFKCFLGFIALTEQQEDQTALGALCQCDVTSQGEVRGLYHGEDKRGSAD